jgi:hypothetical protein
MEIKYDRYKMISPYECTIIIKYTNGYPQYYTEDGVILDMNLAWSGWPIDGNIPTPSWDQNQ